MASNPDIDVFGDDIGLDSKTPDVSEQDPRLWARFLAKWFDFQFAQIPSLIVLFLVMFLYGLMASTLGVPYPDDAFFDGLSFMIAFIVGHTLVFMLLEAFCISVFGNTPGKALMGIRIRNAIGHKLSLWTSLKRSVASTGLGLAFGAPFVLVLTQLSNAAYVNSNGRALWDKIDSLQFNTRPVAAWRWTIGIIVYIVFRLLEAGMQYL